MRHLTTSAICSVLLFVVGAPARAAAADPEAKPVAVQVEDRRELFPAPKSIRQSAIIAGKRINYMATVGSIALHDDLGNVTGEVAYTAYTLPERPPGQRPVTFAFNGGPGAASIALNFGALGPKHIESGRAGDSPSAAPVLVDNPNSWLDFTDLVFVDPIGTGFSRTRMDEEKTQKAFLNADADIRYLSEVVYRWLTQNDRMTSRKYLIGESYGGYRVPRMARYLQTDIGVGVAGIIMVSPYLDPVAMKTNDALSPLQWQVLLPSMAAANLELQGKPLNDAVMAPIELYTRTEFVNDFFAGRADQTATERLSAKVASLTGLDPALVRRLDGRIDKATFVRERLSDEGKVGSGYDLAVTAYDPFPAKPQRDYDDPILAREAPAVEAMVDFVTHQVGWRVNERYVANNYDLYAKFQNDDLDSPVTDLRKAASNDPEMKVMIVHGWNDLSCPYFISRLVLAQMPSFGVDKRIILKIYPGGHMFYNRGASAIAWRRDVQTIYAING